MENYYWLLLALFFMSILYSSVGHGGASGYLAVMAIFGTAPQIMKSSALILNVFVSLIAFYNFFDKKIFNWKLFLPLILGSIPFAFLGAQLPISDSIYKKLLAACILFSIIKLLYGSHNSADVNKSPSIIPPILIGCGIGLLSGMLGIGGGILLSPILLIFNWAKMKETAAISALFIFGNSISGLIGLFSKGYTPNPDTYSWIAVAIIGGFIGGYLGSKKLNLTSLKYALALVLVIASVKLILT